MKFIVCIILLFYNIKARSTNIEIAPSMLNAENKKTGTFFGGFSTGIDFLSPYRDYGNEDIKTFGNITTVFGGYIINNWVLVVGYEQLVAPSEYYGKFNNFTVPNNLTYRPEIFMEVNYYLHKEYFWQPYLIYGMSIEWENQNGSFVHEGVGNHYNFGAGVNFCVNNKFNVNFNSSLSVVKHQILPVEIYMKFGTDFVYQLYRNVDIVYSITYQTPQINSAIQSQTPEIPIAIEFHRHSSLLMEIGFIF